MSIETFIPKLWASALNVPFQNALVYGNGAIADTRFQPMLAGGGRSVTINTIGAAQVRPYDRDVPMTYDDVSTTEVELVMDQESYYGFAVHDIDKVQAAGDFQSVSTEMHAHEMASTVDKYVAGVIADGAGKKIGATQVFNGADYYRPGDGQVTAWDVLRSIALELNKVSAPSLNRWVVVGPNFADALLADRHLTDAHVAGTDQVARTGQVAAIPSLGFTVYQSNNVPVTAGREKITAGVPGSVVFATQLRTSEALRDIAHPRDLFRGMQVYGAQVIRPSGLVTVEADVVAGTLGASTETTP